MTSYTYTVEVISDTGGLTDLTPAVESVEVVVPATAMTEVEVAGPTGPQGPAGPQGNTNVLILGPTDPVPTGTAANTAVFRYRT